MRGREQLRAFRHVILRYRRIGPVLIPVTATPSTSSARAITSRPGVAAIHLRVPGHTQALRAPVGQKAWCRRSTSWRSSTPPSPDIGCLKADTGPPCCDAALRVPSGNSSPPARSICLTTHGKNTAAVRAFSPKSRIASSVAALLLWCDAGMRDGRTTSA